MGLLTGAKSAASLLFSFLKRDDQAELLAPKNIYLKPIPYESRALTKRVDVTRKREFDRLRTLRQKEISKGSQSNQQFVHASTMTDLGEKTLTIKKIDEIEAQMSMQWWKTDVLDMNQHKDSKKS